MKFFLESMVEMKYRDFRNSNKYIYIYVHIHTISYRFFFK